MIGLCNDIAEEKPGRKLRLLVDNDDDTSDLSEEVGSDELLSDDNLRLPESANILVRLHAVRAWLARRREEAIIEVGEAALEFQQAATPGPQETRLSRRERSGHDARLRDTQRVLAAAQQRLQAYEDAQTLLEDWYRTVYRPAKRSAPPGCAPCRTFNTALNALVCQTKKNNSSLILQKSLSPCHGSSSPIMIINCQNRSCHPERMSRSPERSEGEGSAQRETLRCAQGDNTLPILVVKIHYRGTRACPRQDHPLSAKSHHCIAVQSKSERGQV